MNSASSHQAYFEQVWSFVRQVPHGKVVTYGQIAQSLPKPSLPALQEPIASVARLVGSAMATCPTDVPWHRVINAQGRVSSRADASKQTQLLEAEGLCFVQDRIDLNAHQWHSDQQGQRPQQQQQLF